MNSVKDCMNNIFLLLPSSLIAKWTEEFLIPRLHDTTGCQIGCTTV